MEAISLPLASFNFSIPHFFTSLRMPPLGTCRPGQPTQVYMVKHRVTMLEIQSKLTSTV